MTTLHDRIKSLVSSACQAAVDNGTLQHLVAAADVHLERPRQANNGDLSTNICFTAARAMRTNPRKIAEPFAQLLKDIDQDGLLDRVEVAGPGFVNLHLSPHGWQSAVTDAIEAAERYGTCDVGHGIHVLIEFVSANPTGPLHVGHGRGAILGDALARVMRAAGYRVETEYYVNNVGNQIAKLGESTWSWIRALEPLDADARQARTKAWPLELPDDFPEDGYRGDYVAQLAATLLTSEHIHLGLEAPDWQNNAWWAAAEPESNAGRPDDRSISLAAWRAMLAIIAADLGYRVNRKQIIAMQNLNIPHRIYIHHVCRKNPKWGQYHPSSLNISISRVVNSHSHCARML